MLIQLLSVAGVMQDMTRRPRVSFSSLYCLTAHWRQAPTLPSAGCQQKYGISRPSDRQAWSRLSAPSTSYSLPSTWIVAMAFAFFLPAEAGVANGIRERRMRRSGAMAAANLPPREHQAPAPAGSLGVAWATPASNSLRKYLIALPSGSTAPGAWAQKVRPGPR